MSGSTGRVRVADDPDGPGAITNRRGPEAAAQTADATGPGGGTEGAAEWFRGDIDGLRAVAILAVVAYHANLVGFAGGFVGVDVFFVISGYLITTKLVTESERTGRVALLSFWAKRLRRLVPAMASMLIVVLIVSVFVLSPRELPRVAQSGAAASAYVSNILFATGTTTYFGSPTTENPFLHTWSLGVEEQFYLVWPLLIWGVAALAARAAGGLRGSRRRLGIVLGGVLVISFLISLGLTRSGNQWAFFGLPSRAWEFAAAGLAAIVVLPARWRRRGPATAAAVVGLLMIAGAVVVFDGADAYPGVRALVPTVGTLLVLLGGVELASGTPAPVSGLLAHPAMRWVGRVSYSWYLWHWPFMVFASALFISESPVVRVPAGFAALGVAWVVHRRIEDPIRFSPVMRRSSARTFGLAAVITLATLVVAGLVAWRGDVARTWPETQLLEAANQANDLTCQTFAKDAAGRVYCDGGDPDGSRTVVLVGDSHAGQWMLALDAVAADADVRLVSRWVPACPGIPVQVTNPLGLDLDCTAYQEDTLAMIEELSPDLVVVTQSATYQGRIAARDGAALEAEEQLGAWGEAYGSFVDTLTDAGVPVATIVDTPQLAVSPLPCLGRPTGDAERCAAERGDAFAEGAAIRDVEARLRAERQIPTLDLSDQLCDDTSCGVIDGDLIVFADRHHITTQWALAHTEIVRDFLERALAPAGAAG